MMLVNLGSMKSAMQADRSDGVLALNSFRLGGLGAADESENGYQNAHMAELPNFVTLLSLA